MYLIIQKIYRRKSARIIRRADNRSDSFIFDVFGKIRTNQPDTHIAQSHVIVKSNKRGMMSNTAWDRDKMQTQYSCLAAHADETRARRAEWVYNYCNSWNVSDIACAAQYRHSAALHAVLCIQCYNMTILIELQLLNWPAWWLKVKFPKKIFWAAENRWRG